MTTRSKITTKPLIPYPISRQKQSPILPLTLQEIPSHTMHIQPRNKYLSLSITYHNRFQYPASRPRCLVSVLYTPNQNLSYTLASTHPPPQPPLDQKSIFTPPSPSTLSTSYTPKPQNTKTHILRNQHLPSIPSLPPSLPPITIQRTNSTYTRNYT
jgi:hypothetical protein